MGGNVYLLEFIVDNRRYALPLDAVDRMFQAVEVTPVPEAPAVVKGVVNIQGRILPVVSLRLRMGLEDRDMRLSDRLVVAHTPRRKVALLVDEVPGVLDVDDDQYVVMREMCPGMDFAWGVVKLDDDLLVVEDLDILFDAADERLLDQANVEERHADDATP